jgi:hypothetical protein
LSDTHELHNGGEWIPRNGFPVMDFPFRPLLPAVN